MNTVITPPWPDYELIDSGDSQRLERFASFHVVRPDPNVLWPRSNPEHQGWKKPDARFVGKTAHKGWEASEGVLDGWTVRYDTALFRVKPTPFRHLGLFPEQAAHWKWLRELCGSRKGLKVLNLFGYTGAASIVAAQAGAHVCHVDASAGSVNWAKENAALSGLPSTAIRWIVDDALKFMKREVRRGNTYDLILMDPPVFGRGPQGEVWRLEEGIGELASTAAQLFSASPAGFLLNFYATAMYPEGVQRLFADSLNSQFSHLEVGSLVLQESGSKKVLPTGFFLRS